MTEPAPEPGAPALSVAALARRLGVAPDTLRTWDRRYGLGPSSRAAGTRRRYTAADVARLETMRRLTLEGIQPCEAAEAALRADPVPAMSAPHEGPAVRPAATHATAVPRPPAATVRAVVRAATSLDPCGIATLVEEELARRGVVQTWDEVLVPVLTTVGCRWESGTLGVEAEHVLAETIASSLRAVSHRLSDPVNARPVLAACGPEEQHSLPLHALAAALAERRVAVRVLGGRVPSEALESAVRRCGPAAVLVWSQDPATGDPGGLVSLSAVRPPPAVLVGGPGWPDRLPAGVRRVSSLAEAREAVLRALGA